MFQLVSERFTTSGRHKSDFKSVADCAMALHPLLGSCAALRRSINTTPARSFGLTASLGTTPPGVGEQSAFLGIIYTFIH
jgi:hypothetical protein